MTKPIKAFGIAELERFIQDIHLPRFRALQLLEWIYKKHVSSFDEMTNIPLATREQLKELAPLHIPSVQEKLVSKDGSRKYLIHYNDELPVEAVGLPLKDGRLSVCVSTQIGCPMACRFCATGHNGFIRNLLAGEIVDQVLLVAEDFGRKPTNVVLMGQGEPFINYDSALNAMRIINHPKLLNIGARHISVSTSGIIKRVEEFANIPEQFTLAISLHAARQEIRDTLMSQLKEQPLKKLQPALKQYFQKTGRRVSLEYILFKNVNDSAQDLKALIDFCQPLCCHVNLIPFNKTPFTTFEPAPKNTLYEWERALKQDNIAASIRQSKGSDILAACGQLANTTKEKLNGENK